MRIISSIHHLVLQIEPNTVLSHTIVLVMN